MESRSLLSGRRRQVIVGLCLGLAFAAVLGLPFVLRPSVHEHMAGADRADLPTRRLVIVSPHSEEVRYEFEQAFSRWTVVHKNHFTEIEWLDVGGTSDAVRYVRDEFGRTPEGVQIDLFYGGGLDPYLEFARLGLLQRCEVPPEVLELIPATVGGIPVYDEDGRWFGAALAGFGIIYNKRVLEITGLPVPYSWEDLGRPVYMGWIGSGDPRSSGSVHMVYEIILQAYGWKEGWANIVRMGGNIRSFTRSAGLVARDVAVGEVACGMAIDTYAWREIAEVGEERMGFVLPEGLTVVNPDSIAVLKGAPHRELADLFVEFVLSEEGQRLWILRPGTSGGPRKFLLNRIPVIPGLDERYGKDAVVHFSPYDFKGAIAYDSDKSQKRWTILNDLLGACLIDTHEELAAAWKRLTGKRLDDAGMGSLLSPPIGEQELLQMAQNRWQDAAFRARTKSNWAAEARARYRRIAEGR